MDVTEASRLVDTTFRTHFGITSLKERQREILNKILTLVNEVDPRQLRHAVGNSLCALIQLANEQDIPLDCVIRETCQRIERRGSQYRTLGRKLSIGLFGGAFDPITIGHIGTAQLVLDAVRDIDEIWLTPANQHAFDKHMAPASNRLEMCEIARRVDARIKVFPYEIDNDLDGKTWNLLSRLSLDRDLDRYEFSFIIGQDNANTFEKWHKAEELMQMMRFIVVPRPGYAVAPEEGAWYTNAPHIYLDPDPEVNLEVSSTAVRDLMTSGRVYEGEVQKMLDPEVFRYLLDHALYLS